MSKKLAEEEEQCATLANATRKMETEVKKIKEELENMEEK